MQTRTKLHDEIVEVLTLAGRPLSTRTIADAVNRRGRYVRHDGAPVPPSQIHGRTHAYPHLLAFVDGLISLAPSSAGVRVPGKSIVRDYRALGRFFRSLDVNEVTLHFTDIEEILEAPLPPVARRRDTFWQNSDPFLPKPDCSGLMNPDTDLGENARHEEVSNDQATSYVFPGVQTASRVSGARPGL